MSGHRSFPHVWGGIHTPITNALLANSIISRPTILSPGLSYCTTHTNSHQETASRLDKVRAAHIPFPRRRPAAGWLAACMQVLIHTQRLGHIICCRRMSHPAHTTPSSPSNLCDRDARRCVTRLAHHMNIRSPDSAPLRRLGSGISNPPVLISPLANGGILLARMAPTYLCANLPPAGCPSGT